MNEGQTHKHVDWEETHRSSRAVTLLQVVYSIAVGRSARAWRTDNRQVAYCAVIA